MKISILNIVLVYALITVGNAVLVKAGYAVSKTVSHRLGYLTASECVAFTQAAESESDNEVIDSALRTLARDAEHAKLSP